MLDMIITNTNNAGYDNDTVTIYSEFALSHS